MIRSLIISLYPDGCALHVDASRRVESKRFVIEKLIYK